MKNTFLGTVYDGCLNIEYRLPQKIEKQKKKVMKRNLSFLFTETICDTIQLINSVNETNEPFVSKLFLLSFK